MARLLVEAVSSKFGPSFKANGIWHNPDKVTQPDLSGIRQGDELEAEINGKWVKEFEIVSRGNNVANAAPKRDRNVEKIPESRGSSNEGMVRGNALNAAFGASFTHYLSEEKLDVAEAFQKSLDVVERVIDYSNNGR